MSFVPQTKLKIINEVLQINFFAKSSVISRYRSVILQRRVCQAFNRRRQIDDEFVFDRWSQRSWRRRRQNDVVQVVLLVEFGCRFGGRFVDVDGQEVVFVVEVRGRQVVAGGCRVARLVRTIQRRNFVISIIEKRWLKYLTRNICHLIW